MIEISEIKPIKVSGTSSLSVRFGFDREIVDVIKGCGGAVWHKKETMWEVPANRLSFLLDNLVYFDDIDFKPFQETPDTLCLKPSLTYKTTPFKHQLEAIEYGLNHDSWLLLDSPGLGKTLSMICLAEELKAQKGIEHCLIICGLATLRANWEKEIRTHSDLSYVTIGKNVNSRGNVTWATIDRRAEQLRNRINEFFIIINIESIRDERVVDAIANSVNRFDMVVMDEAHRCKSSQSAQGHNLLKIKSKYRIGLSGTLILNNALDCYVPLRWIGVEHSTLTNFKTQYCVFGGFGGHQVVGFKNLDVLKEEIDGCSLRRTKDFMDLPPKVLIDEIVEMSPEHLKFYEDVKQGVKEECEKIDLKASNLLALTTRLRQATTCPSVLTTKHIDNSKIERAIELVREITSQGDKVVVMSTFKEPIYQLADSLKEYKPLIGTGDMKDDDVSKNIDIFQEDDEHKVILCTMSKMGTGITLNRARYMILLDEPWTYALYEQVTDRIHRINNTQSVFIYNLICEKTIDERVAKIINQKKAISDFIVDDKVTDELRRIITDL